MGGGRWGGQIIYKVPFLFSHCVLYIQYICTAYSIYLEDRFSRKTRWCGRVLVETFSRGSSTNHSRLPLLVSKIRSLTSRYLAFLFGADYILRDVEHGGVSSVWLGRTGLRRAVCAVAPPVLQQVTPNLFAMIVVVAFSSCLDVAAIEMEMGTPLDFNGELQTVRGGCVAAKLSRQARSS